MPINDRIASYMPGGDTTQDILDSVQYPVYADPRMRELCTMQSMEMTQLVARHASGRLRLALAIKAEMAECTSDDPTNHQGDTCPIHEGDSHE